MAALIATLRDQSLLGQGIFLAVVGFAGVFVVLTLFFFSIIVLEKLFRAKKEE